MVFLQGGPSHIDIWDPKPDAPANIRGEFKPIKTKIPGTYISEHMPMMAQHLDKATLIRSMSYTPNGLFNHTAAIYQMLTGYPPDKVSPSGQLEPPSPADFPDRRKPHLEDEAAQGSGAAVRRIAAPAAGIGHHRQGRSGRLPRQGLRSLPHVSGPGQAGQARRSFAAQGNSAGAPEGPLRAAEGDQRFHARSREGAQRLRGGRILRQGVRPGALRQGARRDGSREGNAEDARALRPAHLRPEPAAWPAA